VNIGPNIAKALAALQAELPTVAKSKKANVGQYGYTYADLSDVSEAVMPLLSKHGLAFTAPPSRRDDGYYLVGILLHESGEYIEGDYPLIGNQPQQIGSAITYGRRYLLGCMTGVVTDDDDDGTLAQDAAKRPRKAPQQPRKPTPAAETGEAATPAQMAKMLATMSELGMTDRRAVLAWVGEVVGRPVESRNELTRAEAHAVIDALEKEKNA
jgi:hypothetical protein